MMLIDLVDGSTCLLKTITVVQKEDVCIFNKSQCLWQKIMSQSWLQHITNMAYKSFYIMNWLNSLSVAYDMVQRQVIWK